MRKDISEPRLKKAIHKVVRKDAIETFDPKKEGVYCASLLEEGEDIGEDYVKGICGSCKKTIVIDKKMLYVAKACKQTLCLACTIKTNPGQFLESLSRVHAKIKEELET